MFGTNVVRHKDEYKKGLYRVQSIFYTIQGEGPLAGTPAVFVRLAGCNLRCTFCDTEFESGWNNLMTAEELVKKCAEKGKSNDLIVITGGEPMLQNLQPFMNQLYLQRMHGKRVQVETAGTIWQKELEFYYERDIISFVISPKTPEVLGVIADRACAWKYIIEHDNVDPKDGLPYRNPQPVPIPKRDSVTVARPPEWAPKNEIFVQPCDTNDLIRKEKNIHATVQSSLQHGYRVSLQLHKFLNLE